MHAVPVEDLPGFRRRFRITPAVGSVCCQVEDDYHCMSVVVRHDGAVARSVEARMHRVPWTTCPGAERQLQETFAGVALAEFPARGGKKANCTHLHDLALLAAAHAHDREPVIYDILVSDAVDGVRRAELRRGGEAVLGWSESRMEIMQPAILAGRKLFDLQSWIETLEPPRQEAARLLRWGNILANGRSIPLAQQSDASRMPPNCYTFQPERRGQAQRVGEVRDFSAGGSEPLAEIGIIG